MDDEQPQMNAYHTKRNIKKKIYIYKECCGFMNRIRNAMRSGCIIISCAMLHDIYKLRLITLPLNDGNPETDDDSDIDYSDIDTDGENVDDDARPSAICGKETIFRQHFANLNFG